MDVSPESVLQRREMDYRHTTKTLEKRFGASRFDLLKGSMVHQTRRGEMVMTGTA